MSPSCVCPTRDGSGLIRKKDSAFVGKKIRKKLTEIFRQVSIPFLDNVDINYRRVGEGDGPGFRALIQLN